MSLENYGYCCHDRTMTSRTLNHFFPQMKTEFCKSILQVGPFLPHIPVIEVTINLGSPASGGEMGSPTVCLASQDSHRSKARLASRITNMEEVGSPASDRGLGSPTVYLTS